MLRILDDATINQIAAGESIENSASVIKELVENAIDAGASEIHVETAAGGRSLIRVSDNGCGMLPDDLLLAVERHATSKLVTISDLENLHTLGFRGEALASIAAVSQCFLHSATQESEGASLQISGGKIGPLTPLPRQKGTTVEVRSLFFNVPARKKFQKSVSGDTAEIHRLLIKIALGGPSLGLFWIHDGQLLLRCPSVADHHQRIYVLLGETWREDSVPVAACERQLKLTGRISLPKLHRPNRLGQYLFINQRSVISPWLAERVLESYGTRLSLHRHPLFVLDLSLPPAWVDVNVHPQKREVRLQQEERLAPFIQKAITNALEIGFLSTTTPPPSFSLPPLQVTPTFKETPLPYHPAPLSAQLSFDTPYFSIIGKVKHYFFVEEAQGIRMIDSLRALERIIFEQLHVPQEKQEVQGLLIPIQLHVQGKEEILLTEHLENLNTMGIGIRPFGKGTFLIDAIPAVLQPEEISDWIMIYLEEGKIPLQIGKCLKRGSFCTNSALALVKKLFQCQNPHVTPAGKKIHCLLNEQKIEQILI
jgi:DNA mismatch repair protein MutL